MYHTTETLLGVEEILMMTDAFKADTGVISRFLGYKPNTTITSLNLSGDKKKKCESSLAN